MHVEVIASQTCDVYWDTM